MGALQYLQHLLIAHEAGTEARQAFTLSLQGKDMLYEISDLIEVITRLYSWSANMNDFLHTLPSCYP